MVALMSKTFLPFFPFMVFRHHPMTTPNALPTVPLKEPPLTLPWNADPLNGEKPPVRR